MLFGKPLLSRFPHVFILEMSLYPVHILIYMQYSYLTLDMQQMDKHTDINGSTISPVNENNQESSERIMIFTVTGTYCHGPMGVDYMFI